MKNSIVLFTALTICALSVATAGAKTNKAQNNAALNLIHALGCKGCHTIKDDGGSLAPDLTQVGSRLTEKQIADLLTGHRSVRPDTFMPSYNALSEQEVQLISSYLYNLR